MHHRPPCGHLRGKAAEIIKGPLGQMSLRVGGLVFLPRLRPPGVDVGEDIVAVKSKK